MILWLSIGPATMLKLGKKGEEDYKRWPMAMQKKTRKKNRGGAPCEWGRLHELTELRNEGLEYWLYQKVEALRA